MICKNPDIHPFRRKACVWFDETVFHIYAQYVHAYDSCRKRNDLKCIKFLINVWIKFPDNSTGRDVFNLEEYLNCEVGAIDKHCSSYTSMGKTLINKNMWDAGTHLIFTFEIKDFPVRNDIVDVIKNILREAKNIFNFSYSDNKDDFIEMFDSQKHMMISKYKELFQ